MSSRVRNAAKNETAGLVEVQPVANDGAFVSHIDPDLDKVIRQTLEDAQAAGKTHMSQTVLAVQAVRQARPDMTAFDALAVVNLMRREWTATATSTAPPMRS